MPDPDDDPDWPNLWAGEIRPMDWRTDPWSREADVETLRRDAFRAAIGWTPADHLAAERLLSEPADRPQIARHQGVLKACINHARKTVSELRKYRL